MGNVESSNSLTIAAPHVFDGAAMRGPGSVRISNGRIEGVSFGKLDASASIRLPADAVLAPGFIDIQVNGGGGVLLNDQPTESGVRRIIEAHRKSGTTGCLPTLITDRTEVIEQLAAVAQACLMVPGVLGFHLEGPALNRSRKGIHPEFRDTRARSARSRRDQEFRGLRSLDCNVGPGMRSCVHDRRIDRRWITYLGRSQRGDRRRSRECGPSWVIRRDPSIQCHVAAESPGARVSGLRAE